MTTRNGKIARLPKAIREQLNRRLEEGETARALVGWLNGLPEVQALVQGEFGGHAIREQNLSQWKQGGYQEWLRHQEAMELAGRLYEQAAEMRTAAGGPEQLPVEEVLRLWLSARYTLATQEVAAAEGPEAWRQLRQMCGDVAKLCRLEQAEHRLELEQEKTKAQCDAVAIERERWETEKAEKAAREAAAASGVFNGEPPPEPTNSKPSSTWTDQEKLAWVRHPDVWRHVRPLSPRERSARMREIYGLAPTR